MDIWFKRGTGWVLRGAEFSLKPAEIGCVFGPNGTGKSTLMAIITGGLMPQRGTIRSEVAHGVRRQVGWAAQTPAFYREATGQDHVLGPTYRATARSSSRQWAPAVKEVSLLFEELAAAPLLAAPVALMSKGEQRLVENLRAIYHGRSLLCLDEPTSNLHPELADRFGDFLRKCADREGVTIAVVSHDAMWANRCCDSFHYLVDGRLWRRDSFPP
jgi:ABC-type multidrug transport system ATPase subunit